MKNTKILTSAAFFALAAIALLAGCGDLDSPDGKTCKTAQDCTSSAGTKYHCVDYDGTQGTCRLACDKADGSGGDQDSCNKATEECKDYSPTKDDGTIDPNSPKVFACAPKTSTTPGDQDECTTNEDCAGKGNKTVCSSEKKCIAPTEVKPEYRSVIIVDKSTDPSACQTPKDKGVDITGIAVLGPDDTVLEWGEHKASQFGSNKPADKYFNGSFPPAGFAPTVAAGKKCLIDGLGKNIDNNAFTSLGCAGGFLSVSFSKGYKSGAIAVYEYMASQCDSGATEGDTDRYDVYICPQETVISLSDAVDNKNCKKIGDNVSGYQKLEFGK